jgi:hypothetical protein
LYQVKGLKLASGERTEMFVSGERPFVLDERSKMFGSGGKFEFFVYGLKSNMLVSVKRLVCVRKRDKEMFAPAVKALKCLYLVKN